MKMSHICAQVAPQLTPSKPVNNSRRNNHRNNSRNKNNEESEPTCLPTDSHLSYTTTHTLGTTWYFWRATDPFVERVILCLKSRKTNGLFRFGNLQFCVFDFVQLAGVLCPGAFAAVSELQAWWTEETFNPERENVDAVKKRNINCNSLHHNR